jgi:PAS domain S-box-containing protein
MKRFTAASPAEQESFAEELDRRVAQRTAELTATIEQLKRELAERQRAKEALREGELFSLIVESIPVPVAITSPTGEVEALNKPTLEYFGRTFEELKGWKSSDVVHPDDLQRTVATQIEALQTGSAYNVESRHRRADGTYRWFNVLGLPLRDTQGHILRWFILQIDIDDRKRAEEALRSAERNLSLTINTIPTFISVSRPDGTVLSVNQAALDYHGITLQDAQKEGFRARFYHPDDVERVREERKEALKRPLQFEYETRALGKDGKYRWFLVRCNPLLDDQGRIDRWYAIAFDIEDRKRAQEDVRRSEAFLAEAQRLTSIGSFSWRVATDEITWSEELYRIYEFDPGVPVTFELIRSRVHPEDLTLYEKMVEQARNGADDFEWQYRLLMPDQSIKYMHAVAQATRDPSGQLEYIAAVRDVTARRTADEALDRARSELARVARVMSLGALTASIAHEVNQPLSGIITNASTCMRMLDAEPPNVDGARETAKRTIRDGRRAADVITRLRALFSNKEAATELMDLNEATREVIALSRSELERNRVIVRPTLTDNLPLVKGDRVQLQQVILNLLRNASDAMSSVYNRPRMLLIRTEQGADATVQLSVQDIGRGFGTESLNRLFEAFYTTKSDGMGIGLAVSRSIIENHHGRLWATPNKGPGVTFSFSIPCAVKE